MEVRQLAAPCQTFATQSMALPDLNVTLPVALMGRPMTDRITLLPAEADLGVARAFMAVLAFVMVKHAVIHEDL